MPLIITVAPTAAADGLYPEITGVGNKVNPARVPVPAGVVTDTLPVVPLPTTAVI